MQGNAIHVCYLGKQVIPLCPAIVAAEFQRFILMG